MTNSITIRPAISDDIPTIVAFNAALAKETEDCTLDEEVLTRGVTKILEQPALGSYFIAEKSGVTVGQAMITTEWSDWRDGQLWWLQSVYVLPMTRRRGILTALYRHIWQRAQSTPTCRGLRLYVEQNNNRAQTAYRQLGMKETGYVVLANQWSVHQDR